MRYVLIAIFACLLGASVQAGDYLSANFAASTSHTSVDPKYNQLGFDEQFRVFWVVLDKNLVEPKVDHKEVNRVILDLFNKWQAQLALDKEAWKILFFTNDQPIEPHGKVWLDALLAEYKSADNKLTILREPNWKKWYYGPKALKATHNKTVKPTGHTSPGGLP